METNVKQIKHYLFLRLVLFFKIGDRVFTTDSDTGTYAEYALAQLKHTYKLAENLTYEEGSAIGIPYFTVF